MVNEKGESNRACVACITSDLRHGTRFGLDQTHLLGQGLRKSGKYSEAFIFCRMATSCLAVIRFFGERPEPIGHVKTAKVDLLRLPESCDSLNPSWSRPFLGYDLTHFFQQMLGIEVDAILICRVDDLSDARRRCRMDRHFLRFLFERLMFNVNPFFFEAVSQRDRRMPVQDWEWHL